MELIGEVRDFLVNLTSMSNDKLFTLKEKAENEILAVLRKNNMPIPKSVRKDPRETADSLPKF
jgi:type III secretory pathway lipoprotein EscJ